MAPRAVLLLAALLLAVASANKITVTSWCPVTIIGKCPETSCPAPQQVVLNKGEVRILLAAPPLAPMDRSCAL